MNIVCRPLDLISYMHSAINTFQDRMPHITGQELSLLKKAVDYQHQIVRGKSPKGRIDAPFDAMDLHELFSLVVRCADCGFTLTQALTARVHDGMFSKI